MHPETPFLALSLLLQLLFARYLQLRLRHHLPTPVALSISLLLAFHVLLVLLNLLIQQFEAGWISKRLWYLDFERNIPSALSTLQLLLLASLSLVVAIQGEQLPRPERVFWSVAGIVATVMGLEESTLLPSDGPQTALYVPAVVLIVPVSLHMLRGRTFSEGLHLTLLLAGLGLAGVGAFVLDMVPHPCIPLCLTARPLEESLEMLGILIAGSGLLVYLARLTAPGQEMLVLRRAFAVLGGLFLVVLVVYLL